MVSVWESASPQGSYSSPSSGKGDRSDLGELALWGKIMLAVRAVAPGFHPRDGARLCGRLVLGNELVGEGCGALRKCLKVLSHLHSRDPADHVRLLIALPANQEQWKVQSNTV